MTTLRASSSRQPHRVAKALRTLRLFTQALVRQQALVFRPSRTEIGTPADVGIGFEELRLPSGRFGRLRAWWIPGTPGDKAVLFFPGRRGNITHELQTLRFLRRCGASVLALDYPGFGASEGRPSEAGCYAAGRTAREAAAGRGFSPANVILYGRSLGGAVATWLGAQERYGGMVLHGGFSSLPELAAHHLPTWSARLCRISLDMGSRIASCDCPLLVVHSRRDGLVPPHLARSLFERARGPKRWIEVSGNHYGNDWLFDPRLRDCWQDLISGAAQGWERAG